MSDPRTLSPWQRLSPLMRDGLLGWVEVRAKRAAIDREMMKWQALFKALRGESTLWREVPIPVQTSVVLDILDAAAHYRLQDAAHMSAVGPVRSMGVLTPAHQTAALGTLIANGAAANTLSEGFQALAAFAASPLRMVDDDPGMGRGVPIARVPAPEEEPS